MKNNYCVVNMISTSDEIELKARINNILRTLCTEDIEKMSNIDYNIYDTCCNDGSEFQKKECRNNAD